MTFIDTVIIGGGAAGFFAAIHRARQAQGQVAILERSSQVLSKVKISGGGRCNVTHHEFIPREFSRHYPRGEDALLGPFHRFCAGETLSFFEGLGVAFHTEADGRIFPTTNDSQTIIDALTSEAERLGVRTHTSCGARSFRPLSPTERPAHHPTGFEIFLDHGPPLHCRVLLIAAGGTRLQSALRLIPDAHAPVPNVPSLFAFDIQDKRLQQLQGISVEAVEVSTPALNFHFSGPLLITHRGLSGPAVLKLSAFAARHFHDLNYHFPVLINWLPHRNVAQDLDHFRRTEARKHVRSRAPFDDFPRRLWQRLVEAAQIDEHTRWATLSRRAHTRLNDELTRGRFQVHGKSTNKDEFVTAGGVHTDEVDMRTMESKLVPGLYFAGEILNIDGITGGFNFQSAWTTGYLAGLAMAKNYPPA